jgi:hypothetical protein
MPFTRAQVIDLPQVEFFFEPEGRGATRQLGFDQIEGPSSLPYSFSRKKGKNDKGN